MVYYSTNILMDHNVGDIYEQLLILLDKVSLTEVISTSQDW